jgi:hypothetical protein
VYIKHDRTIHAELSRLILRLLSDYCAAELPAFQRAGGTGSIPASLDASFCGVRGKGNPESFLFRRKQDRKREIPVNSHCR